MAKITYERHRVVVSTDSGTKPAAGDNGPPRNSLIRAVTYALVSALIAAVVNHFVS